MGKEERLLKKLQKKTEIKTPIGTELFIPNYSGLKEGMKKTDADKYIVTETDPIFSASEAANFVAGDKANLDNQSGVNTGDQVAGNFNHDDLANIPANDHIDWTNTSSNLNTSGTISGANIYSSGNVGIGTSSPGATLHLFDSGADNNLTTDIDHDALTNFVANEHINWTNTSSNLNTSGTISGANIYSSGNVGIGVSSPAYKLEVADVDKAMNISSVLYVNGSSGNVGIGTSSPSSKFYVDGVSGSPSTANALITLRDSDSNAGFQIGATTDYGWIRSADVLNKAWTYLRLGNTYASFGTHTTESFYVDTSTRKVGIGTTSPDAHLHVYNQGGTNGTEVIVEETTDTKRPAFYLKNAYSYG